MAREHALRRRTGRIRAVLLAFVRLGTNPRIFEVPLSVDRAFHMIQAWLAHPSAMLVHPGDRHFELVRQLLRGLGTAANLVTGWS